MARKRLVNLYSDGKRNYEICFIVHQRLSEEDLKKKVAVVKSIIEAEASSQVVDLVFTKIRSFSYAISTSSNLKGYYACAYTKADPSALVAIKHKISLEADVLRVLIVLANPKKQSYGIFSSQYETDSYKNKNKFFSYDDPNTLSRFLGERGRISSKKATLGKNAPKNQAKSQRAVSKVIKTTRFLSLLPYQED